jgi:hypothetical protein
VGDLGGREIMTEFQLALCKRAASIEVTLESLESDLSSGQVVDLDLFGRLVGHLRRIAETLGLQRVARDAHVLDLTSYTQSKAYRLAAEDPQDLPVGISDATPAEDLPAEDPPSDELAGSQICEPAPRGASAPDAAPLPAGIDTSPLGEDPSAPAVAAPALAIETQPAPPISAPAPPAPPTFQRMLYSGYRPPEPRPAPQPQPAPLRNIAPVWPPEPEAPRRDVNLPSNRAPAELVVAAGPDTPPAPSTEADGLLPSNRPR